MRDRAHVWELIFGLAIGALILGALMVAAFFQNQPLMHASDNPRILSISATVGTDTQTIDYDVPASGIAQALSDDLVALLRKADMQNTLFPPPQLYTVSQDSVYLTLLVSLDDTETSSMRVNLCSDPLYTSAQFGDTYYHIVGGEDLYEQIYDLVYPVLHAYARAR